MTNPTNWPNPERPGVPLFPDRDVAHAFEMEEYPGFVVWEWSAKNKEYSGVSYEAEIVYSPEEMAREYKYVGPVLTTTQINEMLAAERERAAKAAQEVSDTYYEQRQEAESDNERVYADERMYAAQEYAEAIRNLRDAP